MEFIVRIVCLLTFTAHLAVAGMYFWVSPKGFPLSHSRFWLNSVLPVVVVLVALWGGWSFHKQRRQESAAAIFLLSAGWLGGALAGRLFFPLSLRGFWALGVVVAVCGFGLAVLTNQRSYRFGKSSVLSPICAIAGVFSIWAQIPPMATTHPVNEELPPEAALTSNQTLSAVQVDRHSKYDQSSARLWVNFDSIDIQCYPRLQFDRVSTDGFWSLLAPRSFHSFGLVATEITEAGIHRSVYGDGTIVDLMTGNNRPLTECISWCSLSKETYSHLNTFLMLFVDGHRELTLSFSPCPEQKIAVLPSDYPIGRPARIAYMTEQNEFVIAEATSGEKGPFRRLATGPLHRGDPLTINFYDQGELQGSCTLEDWTRQLSTDLSPSAGWGVPMNAIEFRRSGEAKQSPVEIFITLAATSVGRGWETVGHRAGVYRNKIVFEPATQDSK